MEVLLHGILVTWDSCYMGLLLQWSIAAKGFFLNEILATWASCFMGSFATCDDCYM